MAINTALLVSSPTLQDLLVDPSTGLPLSSGTVYVYQDNSRTTFKNWYYQSGSPGNYSYITLPNPLTLSAGGTIVDVNGNDTIPFFYPYSETDNLTPQPYYIQVFNSNGQQIFSRQNFPFAPSIPQQTTVATLRNYIVNNTFWRNVNSVNVTNFMTAVLAPSQHDGYTIPDITFFKNVTGAADSITFTPFGLGNTPLTNDITPEYYCNFLCSGAQAGETQKYIQFPISLHVKTLESVSASITLWAQNVGGNTNNQITLYIYQFLGTGAGTQPSPTPIQTITLNQNWQKFVIPFVFPSAQGLSLGTGGDDALYLQVEMPLGLTCNVNFTKPSIYLSQEVPTNDFYTYDQTAAIINSPRTGDVRIGVNAFYPFGWVPCNDGTIGNSTSNASTRANTDCWSLYNTIWTNVGHNFAPMFTSLGAPTSYGASAYADWSANKALSLSKAMGLAILGGGSTSNYLNSTFTASGNVLTYVNTSSYYYTGVPIIVSNVGGSLPSPLVAGTVYYVIPLTSTTMSLATTYANALAGTVIALTTTGSGTNTLNSYLLGSQIGESSHTLTIAEMPSHNHPSTVVGITADGAAGDTAGYGTFSNDGSYKEVAINHAGTVNAQGGGGSHNIIQPSVFYNIFMKL